MAFLESSVVVYLREILYPEGFKFPLNPIEPELALTEILREAATLVMLLSVGIIAGKTPTRRFGWFIYCFGIWDIFYYIFLKLLLDWPASLLTWDILFLIPTTWTGPVIAPVILSVIMIILAMGIIGYAQHGINVTLKAREWLFLTLGSLLIIMAFVWDYSTFLLEHFSFTEIISRPGKKALYDIGMKYVPESFNWFLFLSGLLIILTGIFFYFHRMRLAKTRGHQK
jgi:hypothetical protein